MYYLSNPATFSPTPTTVLHLHDDEDEMNRICNDN